MKISSWMSLFCATDLSLFLEARWKSYSECTWQHFNNTYSESMSGLTFEFQKECYCIYLTTQNYTRHAYFVSKQSPKQMVTIIVSVVVFLKKKALNFVRRNHVICFYKVKLPPMFKNKVQWLKDCLWKSFLKSCFISYVKKQISL